MPFLTASADVASILISGGLRYAEELINNGFGQTQILEYLRDRYPRPGGGQFGWNIYAAVRDRAMAAITSGEVMMQRCYNQPCSRVSHVGMPGLESNYEYGVQITFVDPLTGRRYMPTFNIAGDRALSGEEIISRASQLGRGILDIGETPKGGVKLARQFEIESISIRHALVAI